jgi:hypothetical protein
VALDPFRRALGGAETFGAVDRIDGQKGRFGDIGSRRGGEGRQPGSRSTGPRFLTGVP